MRAINLIPEDKREGGGAGGRSGGAAYALLGLLAVMVAVVALWTLEKRSVADDRAELAQVEAQVTRSEAQAAGLSSFVQFAGLRASRTQTVTSLAASRFDWSHALRELARVIPAGVSLSSLQGTVLPGVAPKVPGGGSTSGLRSALPVPAIELQGCTGDQNAVARMVTRMRLVDGVTRVSLQSSVKPDGGAGGGTDPSCGRSAASAPKFALVVFFDQAAGAVPSAAPGVGRIVATDPAPSGPTGPLAVAAIATPVAATAAPGATP